MDVGKVGITFETCGFISHRTLLFVQPHDFLANLEALFLDVLLHGRLSEAKGNAFA